ncbi:Cytochrome P450 83B1 [Vitis vinifera]|uniref:Cytochrome P450 83B1 n=1 Tax=Vitis vinifera TaxID=29760 RepID=A0A438GDW7_VITVI|nr:Cytochrome P450 83B1 [Vitis vinifera]
MEECFFRPPGPPGLPFIGNLLHLDKSAPHRYLWQLSEKYGALMFLRLGFVPTLVVSSARMAEEVMKTHDLEFSSRPSLLGQQKAQSFRSIREDEVSRMIEKISKFASASKLVNLSETLHFLTSTIICRIAFSKRYEDEGWERSRFHTLLSEAQAIMGASFFKDYFPFMGWVDKLTGLTARLQKILRELDLFYQEIIDHLNPERTKYEQEDITDILIGGTDTIAAILVWAMTALMKDPIVMKKAQEEIRNIGGKKGFRDEDDIEKLPYLKALTKETMKLHPPIPLIPRATLENCSVNGCEVPPKTLVFVNAWAIGRDPESRENPHEFNPERFLGTFIDFKGQHYGLMAFRAGRRGCPGIYLRTVIIQLALGNLLYSFDWEMPNGTLHGTTWPTCWKHPWRFPPVAV